MNQKPFSRNARFLLFSLMLGVSLVPWSASISEEVEAAQPVKNQIIDQSGTFSVADDTTAKVSEENGKVILSITCKGDKMSITRSYPLTNRPNSGWFVYAVSDREFWSFDGTDYGRKLIISPDGNSSESSGFSIKKDLPPTFPKPFAGRIMQFRTTPPAHAAQPEDKRFITRPGTFPFGKGGTVDITTKNGKLTLALTHKATEEQQLKTNDLRTGTPVSATTTHTSTTTSTTIFGQNRNAPWFVHFTDDGEIWAFDGINTVHSLRTIVTGSAGDLSSSSEGRSEEFNEIPPKGTPQAVVERIKQIKAVKKQAVETSSP